MVWVFSTRQETTGSNSYERFGFGVSRRSNRRPDHDDDSRYSVRSLVDQGRWIAEGLRRQPRSSSNRFKGENRVTDRDLELEQDATNAAMFTLRSWILNGSGFAS